MSRRYPAGVGLQAISALGVARVSARARSSHIIIVPDAPPPARAEMMPSPPTTDAPAMTWRAGHRNGSNWDWDWDWDAGQPRAAPAPTSVRDWLHEASGRLGRWPLA